MKKVITVLVGILLLTGCGNKMFNTPTKKVEAYFSNYQSLDKAVLSQLDKVVAEEEKFNTKQRESYRDLMKKHYRNLTYDIKDEKIDGDTATVTVEIEVTDYSKVLEKAEQYLKDNAEKFKDEVTGDYDESAYMDYRIEQLKKADEKVKYTLEMTLTKVDGEWTLDNPSDADLSKIHGTYRY